MAFKIERFKISKDSPSGVYFLPYNSLAPKRIENAAIKNENNLARNFESEIAKTCQEPVEIDAQKLLSLKTTPLLNSLKVFCSDQFFQGKKASRVSRCDWVQCLTQIASVEKKENGETFLFELLHKTIKKSFEKWHLSPSTFRKNNPEHPLGFDEQNILVLIHYDGPVGSEHINLRHELYKNEGHFIGKDSISNFLKNRSGPSPAGK